MGLPWPTKIEGMRWFGFVLVAAAARSARVAKVADSVALMMCLRV
jgi:hypothetical protein